MTPYDLIKMMTFILIGISISSIMTAAAIEVTGAGTNTNTVTGGSTITYISSSGGGGGGGLSGENYTNIEVNEKYDLYIYKDKVTSYRFTSTGNPVVFVNITGNINAGEIRTSVEVLRDTSTLVKEPASGIIYRNANIWVGTSGFAVAKNIKEAVIRFKVENSWVDNNKLTANEIKMLKWEGDEWIQLETTLKGKDSGYSFFEAKTSSFSSFAIVGLKSNDSAPSSTFSAGGKDRAGTAQAAESTQAEKSPGFDVVIMITAIYAVYHSGRRK